MAKKHYSQYTADEVEEALYNALNVDSELSETSSHAVQNRVVAAKINELQEQIEQGSGSTQHHFLTSAQMASLTAANAVEGEIYIELEGYSENATWVLGNALPIILS